MKVLAIGAHPDDIEIFMYGLLAQFKKLDHEISLIVATDGSLGGNLDVESLKKKRKKEAIEGLSYLGVPVFLDLPDGNLGCEQGHLISIKTNIEKIKPDLIITHDINDYHSDHRIVSNHVKISAGHHTPVLYCDTMMGVNFKPSYYIDISKFIVLKEDAILKHKTQKPHRFVKLVKLMNSYRSAQCNLPIGTYAEAYRFERSFPFLDVKNILPPSPNIIPFDANNQNGFL